MAPYLITFAISTVLIYIAELNLKKGLKSNGKIFLLLAILPITILAGLRTTDLGWDTEKYATQIFEVTENSNLSSYIGYMKDSTIEKGFLMTMFILDKIWGNINFVLFGLQFLVSLSVIIFAYHYKDKCSIMMTFFIYECTLYVVSYSTLRQCLAIAMSFFIIILVEKKKYIWAGILFGLNLFFHNSVIFSISVPIIILIHQSQKISQKRKIRLYFIILAIFIGLLLNYESIMYFLYGIGILSYRYIWYLNSQFVAEELAISFSTLFLKIPTILFGILYFINKEIPKEEKMENLKWFIMLCIDFIFMLLSFKITNIHRVSYYFYYPAIFVFVPQYRKILKKDKFSQFVGCAVILSFFAIFFLTKLLNNYYHMYPYTSILTR